MKSGREAIPARFLHDVFGCVGFGKAIKKAPSFEDAGGND